MLLVEFILVPFFITAYSVALAVAVRLAVLCAVVDGDAAGGDLVPCSGRCHGAVDT